MSTNDKLLEEENQEGNKKLPSLSAWQSSFYGIATFGSARALPLFEAMLRKDYCRFRNRLIKR